ncbi:MAG: hypothetical protein J6K15_08265 [Lachnospiraceae bacterium]|nr:hypothetical protein [Lachnospiraceae bacterium]
MGLLGSLINSVSSKISEQKMKAENSYNEAMNHSESIETSFLFALNSLIRAQKNSKQIEMMGYAKALKELGMSEKVSDETLKREYEYVERQVGGNTLYMLRFVLCRRGLIERDGDRYIKTW